MPSANNEELKKSAFSGAIWKLMERVFAQLVSMIVSIVLARILMPEDYSVASIVSIFFTFCYVLIYGGLNTALIQKKDADILDYSTVLYATLAAAGILYVIVFFCAPLLADLYGKQELIPIFRIMGLMLFVSAVKSVLSAYISNNLQFKKFFYSTIVGTVVSAIVGIAMAVGGCGVWALIAQEMTNNVIDTIFLFCSTRLKPRLTFSVKRFKALFAYGWKVFLNSLINVVYNQISPLIVGLKFTTVDLAYYNKGSSFPNLINVTIGDTVAEVLFPVMSKVQDETEDVLNITRRYIKALSYILFPVMIGFFAVADSFVSVLLTEKWLPAVPYVRIFCLAYLFNLVGAGNLQALRAIGRSDLALMVEVVKKTIFFLVITAFTLFSRDPVIMAISSVVCAAVSLVVDTYPNRKVLGYRYGLQLRDLLPNLTIALVMGGLVMLLDRWQTSDAVLLLAQILTGCVCYVALSILTRNESFYYLLDFLKQMLTDRKRG